MEEQLPVANDEIENNNVTDEKENDNDATTQIVSLYN